MGGSASALYISWDSPAPEAWGRSLDFCRSYTPEDNHCLRARKDSSAFIKSDELSNYSVQRERYRGQLSTVSLSQFRICFFGPVSLSLLLSF